MTVSNGDMQTWYNRITVMIPTAKMPSTKLQTPKKNETPTFKARIQNLFGA